jgi:hypothetical protein
MLDDFSEFNEIIHLYEPRFSVSLLTPATKRGILGLDDPAVVRPTALKTGAT